MDTSWLDYCATEEQLKAFNDEGYLIVEDAISPEMVDALEVVADRLDAEERVKTGLASHELLSKFRTVIEDDVLLELLDNKKVFPLLWDILGWNIQLYISHLIMYPPEPPDKPRVRKGAHWHQDGGLWGIVIVGCVAWITTLCPPKSLRNAIPFDGSCWETV